MDAAPQLDYNLETMPLYEYQCGKCRKRFEALLRTDSQKAACPDCGSKKVERKYSVFAVNRGAAAEQTCGDLCSCGQDGCAVCSAK